MGQSARESPIWLHRGRSQRDRRTTCLQFFSEFWPCTKDRPARTRRSTDRSAKLRQHSFFVFRLAPNAWQNLRRYAVWARCTGCSKQSEPIQQWCRREQNIMNMERGELTQAVSLMRQALKLIDRNGQVQEVGAQLDWAINRLVPYVDGSTTEPGSNPSISS